ncbi:hypothetical protein NDU88_001097 [Pleurodeles waltl]|uniref:EGF-like domain-containing protein n=1 Tax=Pleurodeles waltl TaxID=8319 RepID=A0AAV7LXQ2_PLEWA|nr:hypothetical protein NDU88_001097 [Pleurodeles waltl]
MGDGLDKLRGAVGPVKVISVPQRISKPRRTAPSLLPSANMHGGLMVTTPTHLPGKRLNKWVRKPLPSPPESSHTGMELSVKAAQKPHPGPPWRERTGSLPGALPQEYSEWSKIAPAQARAPKDIAKQLGRGPSAARKSPGWQGQMGRKGCNQQVCAGSTSIPRNPSTRPASFTHAPVSMATRSLRQEPDSSEKTHQSGPEWNVQHVRDGGVTDHASASRLEGANGRTGTDDLQFLTQAGPGRASKVRGLLEPQGLSRSAPSSLLASADSLPRSTDTREFVQPVGMATGASKSETLAQEKAKTTYSSRGLRLQKAELQATKLLNSRAVGGNAGVNARAQPLGLLQGASFTGGVEHNTLPMSKSFKASARPARTRLARLPVRNDGSRTPPFTPEPTSSCSSTGDVQDALSLEEPSGPYRCPTPTGISQEPFGNLLQLRKATFPESTMASDHGNPPSLEAKGLGGLSVLEPITPVDRPPPKQTSPTKQPPLEPSMLEIHSSSEEPNFWEESSSSPAQNTKLPDETSSEFTLTTNPTGDAEITKSHGLLLATSTGLIRATTPQEEPGTWYPPLAAGTGIPDSPTPEDPELLISTVTGRVTKPLRAEVSSSPRPSGRYLTMTTRSSISIRTTLDHQQSHATSAVTVHPTHKTSLSTSHHATSRGVSERSGRVFIVEDQPPILKAQELNVTFKLALETGFAETFDSVDSLQHQALVLSFEETVSPFYKSVPGFLWLEMLSIREGSVILEYAAIFNAESMNPLMMEHPEHLLNLSRLPDAISAGLWVAGHRVLGVSATDRGADLCAIAYTCLDGFTCAHNRNGNITCTSVCHDGFCKNEGICTHRRGQDPMCQCPVGSDYWFMGVRCDYRMTQQALLGISCGVILSLVLCISAIAYLAMRRFKALLVETKINQTKSSYRRFSRFDDISTRYWSHSQSQSWLGASISSLDNLAYSHSEEVLHLHALESRRGSSLEDADNAGTCSPRSTPHRRPECRPGFHSDWETSCSSFNDPMVDSGKASAISVSSWPMEPIQWTPFPILHQLSAQSPFRTRRPHSYCEGMELVNMERSWTA